MKDIISALKGLKGKTLVLTHHNADIDAVASALAMKSLLSRLEIEADLGVAESISRPAQKLAAGQNFIIDPDCNNYENVVLVETSVPEQLASVKNLRADLIVDHHTPGKLVESAKATWIDEKYKSAAQMVFDLFKALKLEMDKQTALWIAAGLTADTAHLRMAGLKEFEDLSQLLKTGLDFSEVLKAIETPPDISERIAVLKAMKRIETWRIGDLLLAFSRVSSHEAAAARALVKAGADISVVVAEKEREVRISSRGRPWILEKGIDLSDIFKKVGELIGGSGGGHNLAGSANGPDKTGIAPATKHIISELERIMASKAKSID